MPLKVLLTAPDWVLHGERPRVDIRRHLEGRQEPDDVLDPVAVGGERAGRSVDRPIGVACVLITIPPRRNVPVLPARSVLVRRYV